VPRFPNTKPWREWQLAAKGTDAQDKDRRCDALRAVQTSVMGSSETEWLNFTKLVFDCYSTVSLPDVTDILNWIKSTMTAKGWNVAMACQILAGFHLDKQTGGAERARVTGFLADLNTAGIATTHINGFLVSLRLAKYSKLLISRMASDDFLGLHKPKLVALCGAQGSTLPAWFQDALTHVAKCPSGTFWLRDTNDVQRIAAVAAVIYADDFWKANGYADAVLANAYARIMVGDNTGKFHVMVTPAQWKAIAAEAATQVIANASGSIIAIGVARNDDAVLAALGSWICQHREAVLALVRHGYSAAIIARMRFECDSGECFAWACPAF